MRNIGGRKHITVDMIRILVIKNKLFKFKFENKTSFILDSKNIDG
jgi:hypothetical protein